MRFFAGMDEMRAEVTRIDAEDGKNFDRFIEASTAIYRVAFEELADAPFLDEAPTRIRSERLSSPGYNLLPLTN